MYSYEKEAKGYLMPREGNVKAAEGNLKILALKVGVMQPQAKEY